MNRYHREVAEMDRRYARRVRWLSFAGAACLAALVLWAAGLQIGRWWDQAGASAGDTTPQFAASGSRTAVPPTPAAANMPRSARSGNDALDPSLAAHPLPLHLTATAPGRNEGEGTAWLGTDPENPQLYVAGAILANGARLAAIYPDHVVIERAGQRAELYVTAREVAGSARKKGAVELLAVGGAQATAPPSATQLAQDPLSDVIRSMGYFESDLFLGLQVFPGRRSGEFSRLGLRPGDIVTAIDGVAVVDYATAVQLLSSLTEGRAIAVTVRRDGAIKVMSLDGSIVSQATATKPMSHGEPPAASAAI